MKSSTFLIQYIFLYISFFYDQTSLFLTDYIKSIHVLEFILDVTPECSSGPAIAL